MTELLASPIHVAVSAAVLAAVVIAAALVVTSRAIARAAAAERQLAALYAEIETAIGQWIDRSSGGGWRDQVSAELKRLAAASPRATGDGGTGTGSIGTAVQALDA